MSWCIMEARLATQVCIGDRNLIDAKPKSLSSSLSISVMDGQQQPTPKILLLMLWHKMETLKLAHATSSEIRFWVYYQGHINNLIAWDEIMILIYKIMIYAENI